MLMVDEGHIALARAMIDNKFHLAWGTIPDGDPTWTDNPPVVDYSTTELFEEVGRRLPSVQSFVIEDAGGTIGANNNLWSLSDTPTRHIHLKFEFAPSEAFDETIYQLAIVINTVENMDSPQVTCEINHTGGYNIGDTEILVDNFTAGTIQDLLPLANPEKGRILNIGNNAVYIKDINAGTGLLTISPLTEAVTDTQQCTSDAIIGVLLGQEYFQPSEIFEGGSMLMLENRPPIFRNNASSETFSYVLTV